MADLLNLIAVNTGRWDFGLTRRNICYVQDFTECENTKYLNQIMEHHIPDATLPPWKWVLRPFPGGKAAEVWHWPPLPPSIEVKYE